MAKPTKQEARKELARRELAKRQAAAEAPSQLESKARGLAQGLSFGFADEAIGVVTGGLEGLSETVSNFVSGKMEFGDFKAAYQRNLEEARAADDAAEEANPNSFMAGEVAGALGSGLATGGAGLAGRGVMGAVKLGAGLGGLAAAGASDASLIDGEVGQLAKDTALGASIGAATGVAGEGISKALTAAGKSQLAQKLTMVAKNKISPSGVAAFINKAGKGNKKKAFSTEVNKNVKDAVEGLQKRGVLSTDRGELLGMDPQEIHNIVMKDNKTLGKSIENIIEMTDNAGVDFGSNKLGIKSMRETVKSIKKSAGSDELKTAATNVEDLLKKDIFKASDLVGIKRELDSLIKSGGTLKGISATRNTALKDMRSKIKVALEDQVEVASKNSPLIKEELEASGTHTFAELNDHFGDTAVLAPTLKDAFALTEEAAGAFEALSINDQIGDLFKLDGVTSAITRGAGKAAGSLVGPTAKGIGAAGRGVDNAVGITGRAAGKYAGKTARKVAELTERSQSVARFIYKSMDDDNVLNDQADRTAHAGAVMSNPALSHNQKFRETNMIQTSGKINPDSIPEPVKRNIMKEIQAQAKMQQQAIIDQMGGL